MIIKAFFTGMVIKKIHFSPAKVKNVHKLKRSWLTVLLANKTISNTAKDLFPKYVIVVMTAADLICIPPTGKYAQHRCGERQLEYFEHAAGDLAFARKILRPPSRSTIGVPPTWFYTMFRNLKEIFVHHNDILNSIRETAGQCESLSARIGDGIDESSQSQRNQSSYRRVCRKRCKIPHLL